MFSESGKSANGQLVYAQPYKLSVLIACFGGSACISGKAPEKMPPFLLLKILLLFFLASSRYVQSVNVVVVTITKRNFE